MHSMGRSQKYRILPNLAVELSGKLSSKPLLWGTIIPNKYQSQKIFGSKLMSCRSQKCRDCGVVMK